MTTFPTNTEHTPTTSGEALALAHRYASRGDPRDFEALVARYQSMVIATCRRVTGTHADAEDACQETFLKLARSAGTIRSNLGAWLHACARQTSIDLLRKGTSRERAEGVAASNPAATSTEPPGARAWHEVRPMLDAALMQLDESDREIIIARFLMGRPQTEMAAEAGITPGSMHRRLDKALERLRDKLSKSGAALGVGVALPAVLGYAPTAEASPALTLALREVGLAGMTGAGGASAGTGSLGGAASLLSGPMLAAALTAVTILATAGSVVMLGTFGAARGVVTSALSAGAPSSDAGPGSTPRPTRASDAMVLIKAQGPMPQSQMLRCEGDLLILEKAAGRDGPAHGVHFRIENATPGPREGVVDFTMRLVKVVGPNPERADDMKDKTMKLRMTPTPLGVSLAMLDPKEMGVLHIVRREGGKTPGKDAAAKAPIPTLLGEWSELQDWHLVASKDDLTITHGPIQPYRFRVLEWTESDGIARVQAICADSEVDTGLIGSRVKLLVRRDAEGYTLAHRVAGSKQINEWPSGFDTKKDADLRVLTFGKRAE